ncbi:MAG: bifunctional chorismate-binding protein/class IV aminotransferase [Kiritimatiellae bacterium]|nr:bifunctional chorismate-binding protein/class IV aminotransferase [Kiritimatiellia bacterium]
MRRRSAVVPIRFRDPDRGVEWRFWATDVLCANRLADVFPLLEEVAAATRRGWWAAGFLAYDAAPALDPAMRVRGGWRGPLAWFALAHAPRTTPALPPARPPAPPRVQWHPRPGSLTFRAAVAEIRRRIAAGRVYQINYTIRWCARLAPHIAPRWFAALLAAQPRSFAALIRTATWTVLSVSPELFFRLEGTHIESRPMKGTRPRAPDAAGDQQRRWELAASPKDRAENVMILDMVRNDLGRIARPGSVTVPALWTVERHPTVWQMTSTAAAKTDAPLPEIFRALFPAASITGAPKIEAMRTIAELERAPRGLYTGAIGVVAPRRRAVFSVAIRTIWHAHHRASARYGAGCGIVWDSEPHREWREAADKTRVLQHRWPRFDLLETLLWRPNHGYRYLRAHLARLRASAEYFERRFDPAGVRSSLARAVHGAATPLRVRLRLDPQGRASVQAEPLRNGPAVRIVGLARTPVRSDDPFLHHKTTHREVYERARRERPECDDAILVNERGEITESTIANVVVRRNGEWLTPDARCGLLRGILREVLLAQERIREAVLRPADLRTAEQIWLINSVRGWMPARLRD